MLDLAEPVINFKEENALTIIELVYYKCYVTASDLTQGSITHTDTRQPSFLFFVFLLVCQS